MRPNVWCTHYLIEGHVAIECPRLRGTSSSAGLAGSSGTPPIAIVAVVGSQGAFPSRNSPEYCEVCRSYGPLPRLCPISQKYSNVPNKNYCELCASTTHHTDQCQAMDDLAERLDRSTFKINETGHGGQGGGMRGGRIGGRGPMRCYNCNQEGHVARNCPLPRRP